MNTYCHNRQLYQRGPIYPVQSLDQLFLPQFNVLSPMVNSLATRYARPRVPPIYASTYIQAPRSHGTSALPSGIANFDRSAIREFNQIPYPWTYQLPMSPENSARFRV